MFNSRKFLTNFLAGDLLIRSKRESESAARESKKTMMMMLYQRGKRHDIAHTLAFSQSQRAWLEQNLKLRL
jgi:hypothetical protein